MLWWRNLCRQLAVAGTPINCASDSGMQLLNITNIASTLHVNYTVLCGLPKCAPIVMCRCWKLEASRDGLGLSFLPPPPARVHHRQAVDT